MQYEIIQYQHLTIAQLLPQHPIMHTPQEVLEMLVNFLYQDVKHIVIQDHHLPPAFFDLSSGLAGEVLQKFSNYGAYAAIVGRLEQYPSTSLHELIRESN